METYVFFRNEGYYLIELENNQKAIEGAQLNPGTVRVETLIGELVWPLPEHR